MMEYYYSMGQDCLHTGSIDDAVTYFRKAANLGAREAAEEICQIGEKLEKGEGVSKDEVKAENCWKIPCQPSSGQNVHEGHQWRKAEPEKGKTLP